MRPQRGDDPQVENHGFNAFQTVSSQCAQAFGKSLPGGSPSFSSCSSPISTAAPQRSNTNVLWPLFKSLPPSLSLLC